jgi:hypothetical protein
MKPALTRWVQALPFCRNGPRKYIGDIRTSGALVPEAEAQAPAGETECRDFKTAHFQCALCWRLATMGRDVLL